MNQDWNNRPSGEKDPVRNMGPMQSGNPTASTNVMQSNGTVPPARGNGAMGTVPPTGANGPMGAVPPTGQNRAMGTVSPIGANGPMGAVPPTGQNRPTGAMPPTGQNRPTGAMPPTGSNGSMGAVSSTGSNGSMGTMPPTGQNRPMGTVPPTGQNGAMGTVPPMGTMQPTGAPLSADEPRQTEATQLTGTNSIEPVDITKKPQGTLDNQEIPSDNQKASAKEKAPAGFFIRLAAYLIDACLTGCIIGMINIPLWFVKMGMSDSAIFQNILFEYDIFDILNFCLMSAYFVIMTYISGRTVGKQLMKIQVVSESGKDLSFGQVFFREVIGKYLSGILYIGYILVGIQDSKKGIHDMIADTKVVYQIDR